MKDEIEKAIELLKAAATIVDDLLRQPIDTGETHIYRREILRRVQASEHVAEAIVWVRRLGMPITERPSAYGAVPSV